MQIENKLSDRLKKYRLLKKLSISEVARRVDVSPSTYRDWEYGRKIKGEPYLKLARALDVSLITLLTGEYNNLHEEILKIEESIKIIKSLL